MCTLRNARYAAAVFGGEVNVEIIITINPYEFDAIQSRSRWFTMWFIKSCKHLHTHTVINYELISYRTTAVSDRKVRLVYRVSGLNNYLCIGTSKKRPV